MLPLASAAANRLKKEKKDLNRMVDGMQSAQFRLTREDLRVIREKRTATEDLWSCIMNEPFREEQFHDGTKK